MDKNFNIIIAGAGGQGLITLLQIIIAAAFLEGKDVKTSELHGLSQRGGSVETHIRIGKKVYSPLISKGEADLVISLEMLEGLRNLPFANSKTVFLVNKHIIPFEGSLTEEAILKKIKENIKGEKHIIPASQKCIDLFGKEVMSGMFLLGYAVSNNLIPIKKDSVIKAIEENMPEKFVEINKEAFLASGK